MKASVHSPGTGQIVYDPRQGVAVDRVRLIRKKNQTTLELSLPIKLVLENVMSVYAVIYRLK